MNIIILDSTALNPGDLSWDVIKQFGQCTIYDRTPPQLTAERIGNAEIILTNKTVITEQIITQCPHLKYIGVTATGYNIVDVVSAVKHSITVTNIPSYGTDAVAQHVFALLLAHTSKVSEHNASVLKGGWIRSPDFCYWNEPLTELAHKTFGVYGFGSIGKQTALIALAHGMNVICHSRNSAKIEQFIRQAQDSGLFKGTVQYADKETFFKTADIISLHTPLTGETENLINKETLSLMKSSVYIINTARGGLVNERDMREALNDCRIAGYAADVIAAEPMKKDNPLLNAPRCTLTPHIAWAPKETRQRLMNIAAENIKAYLSGQPVNVVLK